MIGRERSGLGGRFRILWKKWVVNTYKAKNAGIYKNREYSMVIIDDDDFRYQIVCNYC